MRETVASANTGPDGRTGMADEADDGAPRLGPEGVMVLYDISVPIREGMPVWPGDPEVRVRKALALARGDPADVSALSLGAHTGTHVDAPSHFLAEGVSVERIPLELCVGPARVVEVPAAVAIGPADLASLSVRGCAPPEPAVTVLVFRRCPPAP